MPLLQTLGQGQGYLKAGLLGFAKSGKTHTATLIAIGVRRAFKLKGPIAFFDTESGSEYVAPMVRKETGAELVGVKGRAFPTLLKVGEECVEAGVSVLIVDSVTHVWRSLCDSYLAGVNEWRSKKGWNTKTGLEFQDWGKLKAQWAQWADFYLNSPLHIIICGRAGYEYDMEKNEETGKKELIKTGTKMKTESEFGFEPSLLIEMERINVPDGQGGWNMRREATVIGDRYNVIDGRTFQNPTFEHFKPHIELLNPSSHSAVDTANPPMSVSEDGDPDWTREKKTREILCDEIQGALQSGGMAGQSGEDKKNRADLLHDCFGVRGWSAITTMPSAKLRDGLAEMKGKLGLDQPQKAADQDDLPMDDAPPKKGGEAKPNKPAVEQAPAAAGASSSPFDEEELDGGTQGKIIEALGDDLRYAVPWMQRKHWISGGAAQSANPLQFLTAAHAEKILKNVDAFRRSIQPKGKQVEEVAK